MHDLLQTGREAVHWPRRERLQADLGDQPLLGVVQQLLLVALGLSARRSNARFVSPAPQCLDLAREPNLLAQILRDRRIPGTRA